MRIQGSNAPAAAAGSAVRRRDASGSGFSVAAEDTAPQSSTTASNLRAVGGIDALLALQSDDELNGRRKRAVKRGRAALDSLDELKHALLAGTLDAATVRRLKTAAAELKDTSGEAGLDAVLAEIEVRVEVEIAKLTLRRKD
jgi:hypothetical protein